MTKNKAVTIVVPVYGDLPSLKECVNSLKEHVDTSSHKVMIVNDCGPEVEAMESYLKSEIGYVPGFECHRNMKNLGFVGTCNRAVNELDTTDNDILLLNSDTVVTSGFLEEMIEVLYSSDDIGTVSPRTNNATIATVPLAAAKHKGIPPKKSYEVYQATRPYMPKYNIAPVAHGFCILIRRSIIKKFGLFDTAFGKGYGEEVDFCMRIKSHGWKSAISNWSYVYHMEARSFTLETKKQLLIENNKIIKKRYPNYSGIVGEYVENALKQEEQAQNSAGIVIADLEPNLWKRLIKRNKHIFKFAQRVHSWFKSK